MDPKKTYMVTSSRPWLLVTFGVFIFVTGLENILSISSILGFRSFYGLGFFLLGILSLTTVYGIVEKTTWVWQFSLITFGIGSILNILFFWPILKGLSNDNLLNPVTARIIFYTAGFLYFLGLRYYFDPDAQLNKYKRKVHGNDDKQNAQEEDKYDPYSDYTADGKKKIVID